ncbi:NAD-dependent epimerase/dehydratase family protein [candidate division KSB1 bacterium]|nr:NAD-dependent epimerase/dehydratase family protein [candidate division KSB1 bacterium]MBL7092968.1 NAD-dependent epimerase/dehydratase family protein [candidate division KSB1 bacterium]
MKILVTGGAGFIASHVTDAYINQGHEVVVIDNLSTGIRDNINAQASFVEMDIQDSQIFDLFEKEKFDVVNHHAAQMDIRLSVKDPTFDARNNILGTINLAEAAVRNDVKKFIFISSGGAIYGEQDYFPADEIHPTRPLSPYGIAKLTGEKYLYYYNKTYDLNFVSLRYANVYGPRQNPHGEAGVIAIFASKLFNNETPVINGEGKQTRDYVYVADVVQANVKALNYNQSDYFNIGTGIETDVNELFYHVNHLTDSHVEEKHGPAKPGEQQRSVLNNKKAKELLNWQPTVQLEDGLKKTVDFFKTR